MVQVCQHVVTFLCCAPAGCFLFPPGRVSESGCQLQVLRLMQRSMIWNWSDLTFVKSQADAILGCEQEMVVICWHTFFNIAVYS